MRASTKIYLWGLTMMLFGGASLAEHITSGRGSYPISATVFGIGFVLIIWSYIK